MSDFAALGSWLAPLLRQTSASEKSKLMRRVAIELRKRNQQRIRAQVDADNEPFVPRKSGDGRPMFRELTMARHFKTRATATTAEAGFAGSAARIAGIHEFGRTDVVNKSKAISHKYPRRALLGISDDDQKFIEEVILDHLRG
jgi:phage virion morphogenesis protein